MFAVEMPPAVACQPEDIGLKFTDDATDEFKQIVTDYFKVFAKPTTPDGDGHFILGRRCIHCGSHLMGMLGTFVWDLCYGDFRCGKCKWPGRGCHSVKDKSGEELFSIGDSRAPLALQYLPEFVTVPETTEEDED